VGVGAKWRGGHLWDAKRRYAIDVAEPVRRATSKVSRYTTKKTDDKLISLVFSYRMNSVYIEGYHPLSYDQN